jgi:IS605 OrfB family transposase
VKLLSKYEHMIADLQSEMMTRKNQGVSYVNIASKLKKLRTKRGDVAKEYDRAIISQLIEYIGNLSEKYSLYVGIGRLKYIRRIARKKPGVSKNLRRKIHSWAFARFTNTIMHQLSQLGWTVSGTESRFRVIPESWTSILCWKCGRKGIRPKQNLFVCPTCGNKCNADMNGAINIAGRFLTLTSTLHGVGGRGKWMDAIQRAKNPRPKARGKKSRGKSLLSKGDSSSESGESAAVHFAQSSLASFSDGVGRSDDDPAVGKAIATLSDIDSDESIPSQKKEARSLGEVAPQ